MPSQDPPHVPDEVAFKSITISAAIKINQCLSKATKAIYSSYSRLNLASPVKLLVKLFSNLLLFWALSWIFFFILKDPSSQASVNMQDQN